jgi:outer membrane PBP1 activator LpoA protein
MKKILVALMCVTIAVSFTGCKKKTTEEKMQDNAATLQKDAEKAGKDLQKDAEKAKKDAAKKLDKMMK